jgi:mannose-6-phosphate isomerase-like protein (cupin superfamily)
MQIGEEVRDCVVGDAIAIPPGAVHTITNTGSQVLKFLCCCAPGYEHADTLLVER